MRIRHFIDLTAKYNPFVDKEKKNTSIILYYAYKTTNQIHEKLYILYGRNFVRLHFQQTFKAFFFFHNP